MRRSHQCGRSHCLAERRTYTTIMPCQSIAHMSLASGGNDNSSGAALPRVLVASGASPPQSIPIPSQQNVALACLFAIPARRTPGLGPGGPRSFGCSVNLPLGSRSVDPHSTAVWCGSLLHSSPQPHTAGCGLVLLLTLFTRWSTRYYNQDLRRETLQPGSPPTGAALSRALSTRRCSAGTATATVDCEGASLTWAPSIFGAARFGR